jgi:hypothetical protein
VDIEIVLDQHDGLFVREVDIGQILQDVGIVDGVVSDDQLDAREGQAGRPGGRAASWPSVVIPTLVSHVRLY